MTTAPLPSTSDEPSAGRTPGAANPPPWWPPALLALVCLGLYTLAVWHTAILPGAFSVLALAKFSERASHRWHQAHPDRLRVGWLAIMVSVCALIALAACLTHSTASPPTTCIGAP